MKDATPLTCDVFYFRFVLVIYELLLSSGIVLKISEEVPKQVLYILKHTHI